MATSFLKLKPKAAGSFRVLSPIEAIKSKLSLYLGSSDSDAVLRAVFEVCDNVLDEFNEGENKTLGVIVEKDGQITVYDEGRGIDVKPYKDTGIPIIVKAFSDLHAGGKFESGLYDKATRGTHGLGAKTTNILSHYFHVWTFRDDEWWNVAFENGEVVKKLNNKTKSPIKLKRGTIIRFKLNLENFDNDSKLPLAKLKQYLQLQSYMCSGIKIYYKTPKNEYEFYEKDGLKGLLAKQIAQKGEEAIGKPFILQQGDVNIALSWSQNAGENVNAYASGSLTKEGGTHVSGLNDAIRDALKPYKGKLEFTPAEARDGLVGTMNVDVMQPKFSSQAKERLTNDDTTKVVYDILKPAFDEFFKNNKTLVKIILQRACDLHKSFAKFTADRKSIATLKNKSLKAKLSSKLARATTKDANKVELFLVEGDSAAGTAKQARNKEYQAVLALRGKILNAYKCTTEKLFANEEIQNICMSLGYEGDSKNPMEKVKIGRVVLFADPDVDGDHITVLILSFFQRIMPDLFTQKKIFCVDAPLFYCQMSNGSRFYGYSLENVQSKLDAKKLKIPEAGIQRIKGWGEINSDVLEEVAFDKKTRILTRIEALHDDKEHVKFVKIVGHGAEERKVLLEV